MLRILSVLIVLTLSTTALADHVPLEGVEMKTFASAVMASGKFVKMIVYSCSDDPEGPFDMTCRTVVLRRKWLGRRRVSISYLPAEIPCDLSHGDHIEVIAFGEAVAVFKANKPLAFRETLDVLNIKIVKTH